MKRIIKITLIFAMFLLTMLCTKTFATDENLTINTRIESPEDGVYGVGQEVTIKVTFNKPIKGTMPKYAIYFCDDSENLIEVEPQEITDFTTEVLYKYTIKSGDNGELRPDGFVNATEYTIEDESGLKYYVSNGLGTHFDKKILADTTIEWTDFSEATVEMIADSASKPSNFDVKITNCTLKADNDYYIHLSHNANEEITVKSRDEVWDNREFWNITVNRTSNKLNLTQEKRDIFAEKGDVYITVCEIDNDTAVPKIVLKSKKITKLQQLPLTQRITAFFFDEETRTFCWDVHSKNQQNINYKIGKVTDFNLLKSLKNGQASALNDLLTYARNAQSTWAGSIKLGEDETITNKIDLVDDEYYYVYLQLETVNGKYVEIEDVNLYQALVSENVGKNLFSMDDDKFEWNLEEEQPQFSDFSNAKATPYHIRISTEEESIFTCAVYDIKMDSQKQHKFYYYISNNAQDVPAHDSGLWTAVDKVDTIEEEGKSITYLETSNIYKLPYLDKLDLQKEVYISIYEVISDAEIITDKIEGTYKLVLNPKKIVFEIEEGEGEEHPKEEVPVEKEETPVEKDDTTAKEELPAAGMGRSMVIFAIIVGAALIMSKKCKKYRDII